jgi:hypothetical protein
MESILFAYRSRQLKAKDIAFIKELIDRFYDRGRSHISSALCKAWAWKQPNGKFKECAARDLLLRLEEENFIKLPPRLRPKNNFKRKAYHQIPLFTEHPFHGTVSDYTELTVQLLSPGDPYLWEYLVHHYHYLGVGKLIGEHLRYLAYLNGRMVACLAWASAAFKVKSRDEFIGWNATTRQRRLHFVVNNTRFLVLPWVKVKHLASKILALNLKRLSDDWENFYHHRLYLAETFVDTSRFQGTCYKAANWLHVGNTTGSAKKGNTYCYHGQPKAVYLYPLHRKFRRLLNDDQG